MTMYRSQLDNVMYDESHFWHGKANHNAAHHQFNSLNRNHKHQNFIKSNEINYQERPYHASYSSSESESSQSHRIPKYNSMVIGHSTRSLIQQVRSLLLYNILYDLYSPSLKNEKKEIFNFIAHIRWGPKCIRLARPDRMRLDSPRIWYDYCVGLSRRRPSGTGGWLRPGLDDWLRTRRILQYEFARSRKRCWRGMLDTVVRQYSWKRNRTFDMLC